MRKKLNERAVWFGGKGWRWENKWKKGGGSFVVVFVRLDDMDCLIFSQERICRFAEYSKEAYGMLLVSVFVARKTREEKKERERERERENNRREIFF